MFSDHSLLSTLISGLTAIFGAILLIIASVSTKDTYFLRHGWEQIYALSICSIVIGILTFLLACALLYVVYRKLPALTIVVSVSLLVIGVFALVCLIVLSVGLSNLHPQTYNTTEELFHTPAQTSRFENSNVIIGQIQLSFGCCSSTVNIIGQIEIHDDTNTDKSCCLIVARNFTETSVTINETVHSVGFAKRIYSYLHKRYVVLIVFNAFVFVLLLASAIFGFIVENSIRQPYIPM